MQKLKKILIISFTTIALLASSLFLAFKFSPWPPALLIRYYFNKEGRKVNAALAKHVPEGIATLANLQYLKGDKDAKLDVYYPSSVTNTGQQLPVIVWIHGGGYISGDKGQIANYCQILASKGYCVVSINYSIAPEKQYPLPLIQSNAALQFIIENAKRFHANPSQFILAGDSAGAHIASQMANIISNNAYARLTGIEPVLQRHQLSGLLLYCGPYDTKTIGLDGSFGLFLKTVLWSYSGKKDFLNDPSFEKAAVVNYLDSNYPPCFISAGNGDPLLPQSRALAKKLNTLQIKVDTLFFNPDFSPALPHEYQFNLDNEAGQLALKRSVKFLQGIL